MKIKLMIVILKMKILNLMNKNIFKKKAMIKHENIQDGNEIILLEQSTTESIFL